MNNGGGNHFTMSAAVSEDGTRLYAGNSRHNTEVVLVDSATPWLVKAGDPIQNVTLVAGNGPSGPFSSGYPNQGYLGTLRSLALGLGDKMLLGTSILNTGSCI